MNERQLQIVNIVSESGRATVNELAIMLNTSEVTIRSDLRLLSEKGILGKGQGYAYLKDTSDINYRRAFHYTTKLAIAKRAAELVADGETILIESGSTCAIFFEELQKSGKKINVITNAVHLLTLISSPGNINMIMLGGEYQSYSQALIGPLTKMCVNQYHVDKIFLGTDGYSENLGFTGDDLLRAETVREMARSANQTYVLTESNKFNNPGTVSFLLPNEVYCVITDDNVPEKIKGQLENEGVILLTV